MEHTGCANTLAFCHCAQLLAQMSLKFYMLHIHFVVVAALNHTKWRARFIDLCKLFSKEALMPFTVSIETTGRNKITKRQWLRKRRLFTINVGKHLFNKQFHRSVVAIEVVVNQAQ